MKRKGLKSTDSSGVESTEWRTRLALARCVELAHQSLVVLRHREIDFSNRVGSQIFSCVLRWMCESREKSGEALSDRASRSYDQGEQAASYKWTGWVWEITGWKFEIAGELPIVWEESVEEYTPVLKENRRMSSTCNRLDLQTLRSQPIMPKYSPKSLLLNTTISTNTVS